ncbi:MAG: hypothetical protein ACFFDQ_07710 [Candidatus Thorarchaeota archaeon]
MRSDLILGVTAVSILIITSLALGSIYIGPETDSYRYVDSLTLAQNAQDFEGARITTSLTLLFVLSHSSENTTYQTDSGFKLASFNDSIPLGNGTIIEVRGISRVFSLDVFIAAEIHIHDPYSSPLRSLPGIVIIVLLLVKIYRFDYRKMSFTLRGDLDS